jgi:hypothetical protein
MSVWVRVRPWLICLYDFQWPQTHTDAHRQKLFCRRRCRQKIKSALRANLTDTGSVQLMVVTHICEYFREKSRIAGDWIFSARSAEKIVRVGLCVSVAK